jgi:hypothetical protein
MRSFVLVTGVAAALAAGVLSVTAQAEPPFSFVVILRSVGNPGAGFGVVNFSQPKDADKIAYLETWVHLAPNRRYSLQRAVDMQLDGKCTSTGWLTLGKGLAPRTINTDAGGSGHEALFRDLAAIPTGTQFDIHFRVIDAATSAPVLSSRCYRFAVRP